MIRLKAQPALWYNGTAREVNISPCGEKHTKGMRIKLYRREADYWIMHNFTHDDTIELTSLGIQFPVVEVYEKTTFDESFSQE